MSGNGHSHMAAACGFVVCVDDFAIFEDADAGCTTTDIDNGSIGDLQHSSSGCRFVYDVGDFKPGTFKYISDAFDAAFGNSRRDRSSGIRQFNTKSLFQFCFEPGDKLDGFIIVYDHTILNRMRRCGNTCDWAIIRIDNGKDCIGSTKVDTHFQASPEFLAFAGFYQLCKIR